MKTTPLIIPFLAMFCASLLADGPSSAPSAETPEQHQARMAWWHEAKFGMFIHWGLYAIPADGEWHMRQKQMPLAEYAKYAAQFNPTKFNADDWMQVAQDAGMKYLVITSKHHDGFAMFDSKASDYNVVARTPFKRDPLKALAEACPRHGIRFGVYYSAMADWGHPGGGAGCPKWDPAQQGEMDTYLDKVAIPQVKELLTNYGPIGELWFDSDGARCTAGQGARFLPVLALQPQLIVNPRLNGVRGDFDTAEKGLPMRIPKTDWEFCTTTNPNWGFTHAPASPLDGILRELSEAWGKGGNVLLNVGPDATGIIPDTSVSRLHEVGAWMRTNGEAIYDSKAGPYQFSPWGATTRKGEMLYLFVFHWPAEKTLRLPMGTKVKEAWLLADPTKKRLTVTETGVQAALELPADAPDPSVSVIAVRVAGEISPFESLVLNKPATASSNGDTAKNAVDDDNQSRWQSPENRGWLSVDMGKPMSFSTVRLNAAYASLTKIALEVPEGDQWKTVWEDDKPKASFVRSFPPVTAQVVPSANGE